MRIPSVGSSASLTVKIIFVRIANHLWVTSKNILNYQPWHESAVRIKEQRRKTKKKECNEKKPQNCKKKISERNKKYCLIYKDKIVIKDVWCRVIN